MELSNAKIYEQIIQAVVASIAKAVNGCVPGMSKEQQEGLCGQKRVSEGRVVGEELQEVNQARCYRAL